MRPPTMVATGIVVTPTLQVFRDLVDLLPAGPTGFYWADGILMGSTLHP